MEERSKEVRGPHRDWVVNIVDWCRVSQTKAELLCTRQNRVWQGH